MSLAKLDLVAHHEPKAEHDCTDHGKDERHVEHRRQAVDEGADRLDHEQECEKAADDTIALVILLTSFP